MQENNKNNFHEFSLKSSLFKGRPDLYFCYLKSEKIAHALALLLRGFDGEGHAVPDTIVRSAAYLPAAIARFAAGEFEESSVLVDIYELLSLVRIAVTSELLDTKNAEILVQEFEGIAEKIALGKNASPFLSLEDFAVPPFVSSEQGKNMLGTRRSSLESIKDKTHNHKGQIMSFKTKGQNDRLSLILKIVNENKRVSIKDISKVIKNCSEKTIQRELGTLIHQGLVRKVGEKRWSFYFPANSGSFPDKGQ